MIVRLFSAIVLFCIYGLAFADDSGSTQGLAGFLSTPAIANHSDLSISYLGQVFGTVGDVLQGSSGQLVGMLFYRLNQGMLIVAALWLGYTSITVVLRSAQEGSFMGPNRNVGLIFLKIALGVGLLLPNPSTGYSIFQDIVMKVTVEGVGLADQTWDYALQYLQNGGRVYRQAGRNQSMEDPQVQSAFYNVSTQVFEDEVCMLQSGNIPKTITNNNESTSGVIGVTQPTTVSYNVIFDPAKRMIAFPGYNDNPPFSIYNYSCGLLTAEAAYDLSTPDAQKDITYQALRQMVLDDLPAARRYVCANGNSAACATESSDNVAAENEQDLFSSVLDYNNLIVPYDQYIQDQNQTQYSKFYQNAETEGWLSAGRYYWDLTRLNLLAQATSTANDVPSIAQPTANDPNGKLKPFYVAAVDMASSSAGYKGAVLKMLSNYNTAQNKGDAGIGKGSTFSGGNWWEELLYQVISAPTGGPASASIFSVTRMFQDMGHYGNGNPIMFFAALGQQMIAVASNIWVLAGVIMATVGLGAGVCASMLPFATVFNTLASWVKPVVLAICGFLFAPGIILGYYVPLYPYLLFTFGCIGWIIAVMEAMVAAPLVCFGLTHPEGHDFLGRAEQAVILLLGVFIRPVLMVIGLLAAIVMSYVAFKIVNYGFASILNDIYHPSTGQGAQAGLSTYNVVVDSAFYGSGGSALTFAILVPVLLFMFGMVIYMVTNFCYSLIHVLPNNILMWIGGQPKQDQTMQMAQQVQGATMSGGKQGFDMGGQMATGISGSLGNMRGAGKAWHNARNKLNGGAPGNNVDAEDADAEAAEEAGGGGGDGGAGGAGGGGGG